MSLTRRTAAASGFLLVTALALGQPAPKAGPPAPGPTAVPAGVKLFASLNVAELWDHRALAPVREARGKLEFAWAVQALVGMAPEEMDRLTLFWHPSVPELPYAVVTGRKAVDPAAVAKTLSRPGTPAPKAAPGGAVPVTGSEFAFVYPADAKTVLLAPAGADPAGLAKVAGLLPALQAAAAGHALTVGVDVKALDGLPLPVGGPLLEARTAVLTVALERDTATARLTATYPTDAAAKTAAPVLTTKFAELAGYAKAQQKKVEGRPPEANAYPAPLFEFLAKTMADAKVRADGAALVGTAELKLDAAVGSVLTALPDAALSPRGPSAAENNLKQIGLAIHSYHDANGRAPANVYAKDGTPLLSWRVQLLPYMEQVALHQKFKLDEAWDSPANKQWSQAVIRTFQVPGRPANQPWETYFQTFTSPKDAGEHRAWLVDGDPKGPQLTTVTDGLSNTIMVVEAGTAVPWAKPEDLPYDGKQPLPRLGGPGGVFAALFGDGSVGTFRRAAFDDTNLRRCISVGDGNPVNIPGR
jgi:hypothetical protein